MSHQFPQSRANTWTATNTFSGATIFSGAVTLGSTVSITNALTLTASLTHRTGTATAGTAPAYYGAGVVLTTPVLGAFETDSSYFPYFTVNNGGNIRTKFALLDINQTFSRNQIFKSTVGSDIPIRVQEATTSPTGNLQTWEKGGGSPYSYIDPLGKLFLGLAGTQTGVLNFNGTTSGVVTQTVAAAAGTWTFTLPTTGGTSGYALTTNGSGVSTWAILGAAGGGTGLASYAVGDIIYASGTTTLAKLADVATGSVLVSGGVTTAPAWSTLLSAGIVKKVASGRATAQTAANTNILTYATPAADGSYEISCNVLVTTATLHSFSVTVDYTDEGNTARTITMPVVVLAGTTATLIANAAGAVPYEGVPLHIRTKASSSIVFKTAGTFTTVTYNVDAVIKQTV